MSPLWRRNFEIASRFLKKISAPLYIEKVKEKFALEKATKAQRGSTGTALLFH
jgi:hypothetical protein